jgi:hypothetical protein
MKYRLERVICFTNQQSKTKRIANEETYTLARVVELNCRGKIQTENEHL